MRLSLKRTHRRPIKTKGGQVRVPVATRVPSSWAEHAKLESLLLVGSHRISIYAHIYLPISLHLYLYVFYLSIRLFV